MRHTVILALAAALVCCEKEPQPLSAESFNTNIPLDEVMDHVMDAAADAFWGGTGTSYTVDGGTDLSPKTEAEWKRVEDGATTVAVAANALMLPGYARQPVADWNRYAREVSAVAERAKAAVEAKDIEAMKTIGVELDTACEACHMRFTP